MTRADMEAELLSRLQAATNSTLYPAARLTKLIQDAYNWATQLVIWQDLVEAKTTRTRAGREYYDYPQEFRTGTIVQLTVDGEDYDRKNYEDYQDYKRNNAGSSEKMFAIYGRKYFIHPTPTTEGDANLDVWGAIQADALSSSVTKTIFSDNKEAANEAVIRKAFSVAVLKSKPNLSEKEENAAAGILIKINKEEWSTTQRDQRIQHPRFEVPNFIGKGMSRPGNFGRI